MAYSTLLIPLIVAVLAQVVKLGVDRVRGNLNVKNLWLSYGGMPSAHSAFAVSAATSAGLADGWTSPLFAVAAVFSLIIMRDAVTFRNFIGQQGARLNRLVEELPAAKAEGLPHLREQMGHSPAQVLVGAVFGVLSTLLLHILFGFAGSR